MNSKREMKSKKKERKRPKKKVLLGQKFLPWFLYHQASQIRVIIFAGQSQIQEIDKHKINHTAV